MMSSENSLRAELARVSIRVYDRGLVGGTGGNVSVRLDDAHFLITPSGVSLGDTTAGNIIKVSLEALDWTPNDPYIPSKEYRFHAAILEARSDVNGVVHCHPPYATAFGVRGMDIPYVTDAAFKQPPMPHVSFSPSGSDELVDKVANAIRGNDEFRTVMLAEHGIIAVGADLVQALDFADLAEEMAKIAHLALTIPSESLIPDSR